MCLISYVFQIDHTLSRRSNKTFPKQIKPKCRKIQGSMVRIQTCDPDNWKIIHRTVTQRISDVKYLSFSPAEQ